MQRTEEGRRRAEVQREREQPRRREVLSEKKL